MPDEGRRGAIFPRTRQHAELAAILETQRRLYNDALAERIDAYRRSLLAVETVGFREPPISSDHTTKSGHSRL